MNENLIPKTLPSELQALIRGLPKTIQVRDEASYSLAGDSLRIVATIARQLRDRKDSILKPLRAAERAVKALFAPFEQKLEALRGAVELARKSFRAEQELIAEQARAKQLKKAAARANVLVKQGVIGRGQADQLIEAVPEAVPAIPCERGVHVRKLPRWRVADRSAIPAEWFMLDEARISAHVRRLRADHGIPGIEYYEEEVEYVSGL